MRAAELLVRCLEAEGVEYVFGIPGEETLDLNEALEASAVRFVPVRHEQGGAFIADVLGRLTGRAGVALGTLGPGATNLTTPVADAYLDRAPLVVLTGQTGLERMHKESHQYLDVISMLRPITKWNARVALPDIVAETVRKAFDVAEQEKPGATHLELPEDVMAAEVPAELAEPLPRSEPVLPEPSEESLSRAVELICGGASVVALAGNGVVRGRASGALREFSDTTGIPVAETFMAKGLMPAHSQRALGATGLQAGDYEMAGFPEADVVLAIGYDLVEQNPQQWNPRRNKTIVCIDSLPAEVDGYFSPAVELVGDIAHILSRLTAQLRDQVHPGGSSRLREATEGLLRASRDDARFPMSPPRLLAEIRDELRLGDVLISDVGLHKLWIGRMFPADEPNKALIANGLAGMGFAVPAGIAAKLVHPAARVVAVCGDGGFLMNVQELETAKRLRTPFVSIVWENGEYGSITWKQERKFGSHFGTAFDNPDLVKLADAFGLPGWRVGSAAEFAPLLRKALDQDQPSVLVVPVDYSMDVAIAAELGEETVKT